MATFAERLKFLRKQKGLVQKELAALLGVKRGTVASWEAGTTPELGYVTKMAEIFGVSIDYLLGRSDDPSPPQTESKKPSPEPISLDEALDDLLSRADVMFDGLPVGELDEDVRKDLRAAVRAVLEYEMRRRGKEAGPPKGRAAAAAGGEG